MKVLATDLFKINRKILKEDKVMHNEGDELDLSEERANYLLELGYVKKPVAKKTTRKKATKKED